jgi:UDP-N-acetyl-D-galactosamine dehydrogenase
MIIAVIGLGYVGLPLVVEFGKYLKTIGFDIAQDKVKLCSQVIDPSKKLSDDDMGTARLAEYTADPAQLRLADYYCDSTSA